MYSKINQYVHKYVTRSRTPLSISLSHAVISFWGGFFAIFLLALLSDLSDLPLLLAPFGASCVLAFALPDAPFSQPRNIIGGHLITTLCGLIIFYFIGNNMWSLAIGVGLGISFMILTKTTHPPAGANPIVVITSTSVAAWHSTLIPILLGSIVIVCVAIVYNNLFKNRKYPTFWL